MIRSNFKQRLASDAKWYVIFALSQLIIFAYYWFTWQTFSNFLESLDHDSKFMMDFTNHYYPMSKAIIYRTTTDVVYLYPTFFAIVISPLATLSIGSAQVIWVIIQFACLVTLYIISVNGIMRLSTRDAIIFALLWTTSFPLLHNFKWGQVSLLITTCVTAAVLFSYRQKSILSGLLLAFATAIKLYPGIFIIYLVAKRDRRAIITFAIALVFFYVALPATVMGLTNWFEFEKNTQAILSNVNWGEDINSQYIANVGLRWIDFASYHVTDLNLANQVLSAIGYAIVISCVAIVWSLRKDDNNTGLRLSMVAIFIATPFLIKSSWPHYFTYLPLCQIVLYYHFLSPINTINKSSKLFTILPMISIATSNIFTFNLFPNWQTYNGYGMLFLANIFLLAALYVAFFTGRSVNRPYRRANADVHIPR